MGEVDHLSALRGHGEGRNADVHIADHDGVDDAVKGHVLNLQLHAQLVGDLLSQPAVAANGVGVVIQKFVGAVGGFGAYHQHTGVLDLFQYALRRGGHGANDQTQGQRDRENFLHHGFVPPKSLECLFTLRE